MNNNIILDDNMELITITEAINEIKELYKKYDIETLKNEYDEAGKDNKHIKYKYYKACDKLHKESKEIRSKIKIFNELKSIDFNSDENDIIRKKKYNSSIHKALKGFAIDNEINNLNELLKELCKLSLKDIYEWYYMSLDKYKRIIVVLNEITNLDMKNERLEEYEQIEEEIKQLKEKKKELFNKRG